MSIFRSARTVVAACLAMLAAGCALPQIAWQRADDIVMNRANEWLALEPPQQARLQARLAPWLREVRRVRLDEFARALEELAVRITPDLDLADTRWAEARFRHLYDGTVESFLSVLAPTLADLDPRQIRHLARRFREENREDRERYVTGRDKGRYALAERIIEQVERWTGSLSTEQRALVHARMDAFPENRGGWLAYRQRMQEQLLAHLEDEASATELERFLHVWWVERDGRRPGEVSQAEAFQRAVRETLVALGRSLSPMQRAEASRRLRDRAAILRQLAETAA